MKNKKLEKYLSKQYKEAIKLRDMRDKYNPDIPDDLDAYYQGKIDLIKDILCIILK